MASIQTGGARSNQKPLDSELPLVPFIDLLLCCVMFLLVTAVWNQLRALEVTSPSPSPAAPPSTPEPTLRLVLTADAWLLATPEGARFELAAGDLEALGEALASNHLGALQLSSDDGVPYHVVVAAIDAAVRAGIADVAVVGDGR